MPAGMQTYLLSPHAALMPLVRRESDLRLVRSRDLERREPGRLPRRVRLPRRTGERSGAPAVGTGKDAAVDFLELLGIDLREHDGFSSPVRLACCEPR